MMNRAVPLVALAIVGLAYLNIPWLAQGAVGVLLLTGWAGALENLPRGTRLHLPWAVLCAGAAYLALMAASVVVNLGAGLNNIATYLLGVVVFMYTLTMRDIPWRRIVNATTLLGVAHAVLGIVQYVATGLFDRLFGKLLLAPSSLANGYFAAGRITGLWIQAPAFGAFLAVVLPFAIVWYRSRQSRYALLAPSVIGLALLMTGTRIAIVGGLAGVLLMLWGPRRRGLAVLIPVVVTTLVVAAVFLASTFVPTGERLLAFDRYLADFAPGAVYNRSTMFAATLEPALRSPVLGGGFAYQQYLMSGVTSAHNSYIQSALMFGWPATLILVGLLVAGLAPVPRLLRESARGPTLAAALGVGVSAVVGFEHSTLVSYMPLNILFWLLLGLTIRSRSLSAAGDAS